MFGAPAKAWLLCFAASVAAVPVSLPSQQPQPLLTPSSANVAALHLSAPPWVSSRLLAYHHLVLARGAAVAERVQQAAGGLSPAAGGSSFLQLEASTSFVSIIMCIIIVILAIVDASYMNTCECLSTLSFKLWCPTMTFSPKS